MPEKPAFKLKELAGGLMFASIKALLAGLEVVENELIPLDRLAEPLRGKAGYFHQLLEQFRLLTYGQPISRAMAELQNPAVADRVHGNLRHLIVYEYQDVNPAQERLVRLPSGPDAELRVLGDDDQAVYQWRGSNVRNIVEFPAAYPSVETFRIAVNRPGSGGHRARRLRRVPGRTCSTTGSADGYPGARPRATRRGTGRASPATARYWSAGPECCRLAALWCCRGTSGSGTRRARLVTTAARRWRR